MPTKKLPAHPDLTHLKHQAKDLISGKLAHDPAAYQRILEFHPRFRNADDAEIGAAKFALSDAQFAIAREYGFASWAQLKARVDQASQPDPNIPHHERIENPAFRTAVDLLDAGDAAGLSTYLNVHPEVARQKVFFNVGGYFGEPTLLEFAAENPIRTGALPANIVDVAKVILEAGAKEDMSALDRTLGLVSSGRVPRECQVQIPLIDLLCDYGADPNAAMGEALGHGEFAAVDVLIRQGARFDLPTAAATGRTEEARKLLAATGGKERHRALAYATQFGHLKIVRMLLDAGEDLNRFNPVGCHSHSTPLHQAAYCGHLDVVRLLVENGANTRVKDILWGATPLGWAEQGGQKDVATYLRGL